MFDHGFEVSNGVVFCFLNFQKPYQIFNRLIFNIDSCHLRFLPLKFLTEFVYLFVANV